VYSCIVYVDIYLEPLFLICLPYIVHLFMFIEQMLKAAYYITHQLLYVLKATIVDVIVFPLRLICERRFIDVSIILVDELV